MMSCIKIVANLILLTGQVKGLVPRNNKIPVEPLIVGGVEATPHEFPWQVSIQSSLNLHLCGGVILDKKTVLTTAACADLVNPFITSVAAGKHNLSSTVEECSQILRIIERHLHPDYPGASEYSHDIAVLKTLGEFTWTECVSPLTNLHNSSSIQQETGEISGWGTKREENLFFSETLQKATVNILASNEDCQILVGSQLTVEDSMVCIASPTNSSVDSCSGDQGGPLIVTYENRYQVLAGLISFGIGCGRAYLPSFCTRVSPYIEFIQQYLEAT